MGKLNLIGGVLLLLEIISIATLAYGFRDAQDGAKILTAEYNTVKDTYSIPLRSALKAAVLSEEQRGGGRVKAAFDDAEFILLSRMKTVEIPPSEDATNFYDSSKHVNSPNRFATHNRQRRSPQGLKFDDGQSSSKSPSGPPPSMSEGSSKNHPKSIADQLPRQGSLPQSSSVNFEGSLKDPKNKGGNDEENKRLYPELFGHGPYGHHGHHGGGGYYPGGGHPYYPTAGLGAGYPHHGYPGYGNGGYYGGGGGYYPGVAGGYPGVHPGGVGLGGGGSSAAAAATASGSGYRPGFGGGGLYGNGYHPNNGYYGAGYPTTYPYLNGGLGGPGFGGGFFRDEEGKGGKVSAGVSSDSKGKVTGGVSFE